MDITVSEAKARFSEILKRVEAGETVVVTRHGKPVARIEASGEKKRKLPRIGAFKGEVWMSDDFDEPLEEFREYME